MGENYRRKTMP